MGNRLTRLGAAGGLCCFPHLKTSIGRGEHGRETARAQAAIKQKTGLSLYRRSNPSSPPRRQSYSWGLGALPGGAFFCFDGPPSQAMLEGRFIPDRIKRGLSRRTAGLWNQCCSRRRGCGAGSGDDLGGRGGNWRVCRCGSRPGGGAVFEFDRERQRVCGDADQRAQEPRGHGGVELPGRLRRGGPGLAHAPSSRPARRAFSQTSADGAGRAVSPAGRACLITPPNCTTHPPGQATKRTHRRGRRTRSRAGRAGLGALSRLTAPGSGGGWQRQGPTAPARRHADG